MKFYNVNRIEKRFLEVYIFLLQIPKYISVCCCVFWGYYILLFPSSSHCPLAHLRKDLWQAV